MRVVIRPRGTPVLPRVCPAISRGVPGVTLLRPQRGSQSGEAEFRVRRRRRGAEDTAVPLGGSPSVSRRVPRTVTRSRAHQEAGRWPGTGVPGEDWRPGAAARELGLTSCPGAPRCGQDEDQSPHLQMPVWRVHHRTAPFLHRLSAPSFGERVWGSHPRSPWCPCLCDRKCQRKDV